MMEILKGRENNAISLFSRRQNCIFASSDHANYFYVHGSVTMYLFYKKSKKDEQAFNDKYEKSIHDAKQSVETK